MNDLKPITMVMVDDNLDEIFLTRRKVRNNGIINHFISEKKSENLIQTLVELNKDETNQNILILLDINMPRQSGFETLKMIRGHDSFSKLPVIMFSASDDDADMATAAELGANGYIVKPFTLNALVGALGTMTQMRYHLMQ